MKKRYRLKEKWGVVLFYITILTIVLLNSYMINK